MLMRFDPFREFDSLAQALTSAPGGSRRNFASITGMQAERFDVAVDAAFADDALRRLAERPTVPHDAN